MDFECMKKKKPYVEHGQFGKGEAEALLLLEQLLLSSWLEYEYIHVDLYKGGQSTPEFKKMNPMGAVPVLVDGDFVISDSLAIIMYLDDKYPEPPLLPRDLHKRAINFQTASIILSGIHPHQNKGAVMFVEGKLNKEQKTAWMANAIRKGLTPLEKLLASWAGKYATGDEIYLADLFLAAQITSAISKSINMERYPTLAKCYKSYKDLPAFQNALPEKQPDAPALTSCL